MGRALGAGRKGARHKWGATMGWREPSTGPPPPSGESPWDDAKMPHVQYGWFMRIPSLLGHVPSPSPPPLSNPTLVLGPMLMVAASPESLAARRAARRAGVSRITHAGAVEACKLTDRLRCPPCPAMAQGVPDRQPSGLAHSMREADKVGCYEKIIVLTVDVQKRFLVVPGEHRSCLGQRARGDDVAGAHQCLQPEGLTLFACP